MTEVKALLLTDVVGSTHLSERLGDEVMADLWAAHDRAARDLLRVWRGREIDKTDGMLLMFDAVADAVRYALAYHRALAAMSVPLKARAGLHVGPVILRENAPEDVALGAKPLEVDGLAKPMTARVMSLAGGGQILLTPEALAALDAAPNAHQAALARQSHGHWVMKGLGEPVELFEVVEDKALFREPPESDSAYRVIKSGDRWVPLKQIPNNLPRPATSFIGREREIQDLKSTLRDARLITLLGMGGMGKTRLCLQVATETLPHYPDGAWFVDLSPIRDPALVIRETARVLDVTEEPGRALVDALCAHLKPRRLMLVFDNCEHLIDPTGELVHALLQAAPDLRILASSREPLDVPGERCVHVEPLPLPRQGDNGALLQRSTAVRLFVDRVRAHRPEYQVPEHGADGVADLVARLEGIPLAIELAAARMRTLTVAEIGEGLRHRFEVLTGGSRRLHARQQTLRALVDWSYDLLDASDQCLLDRLGVFVGGFDLPAAVAVARIAPVPSDDLSARLDALTDKSLAIRSDDADGPRWRMLETIREYAREKLEARGELATVAARHCEHYFARAKDGNRGLDGPDQAQWLRRFETEVDNLRAATATALAGGVDRVIAVKLAVAQVGFWTLSGMASEGRAAVRAALTLPEVTGSDMAHAWGLYAGAALASLQGDHQEARTLLETCLALRRGLGDPVQIAATLSTLSLTRLHTGDPAGARAGELEALALFRGEGDRVGEAIGLLHLGQISLFGGDLSEAGEFLEQSLNVAREIGHREVEGESELMLGEVALEAGDLATAQARIEVSLSVCKQAGDRTGEANAHRGLGRCALARGDCTAARRELGAALAAFEMAELRESVVDAMEDHAALLFAEHRVEEAAELAGAADQARIRTATVRARYADRIWTDLLHGLREALGEEGFDAAWQRGRRRETAQALALAREAPNTN